MHFSSTTTSCSCQHNHSIGIRNVCSSIFRFVCSSLPRAQHFLHTLCSSHPREAHTIPHASGESIRGTGDTSASASRSISSINLVSITWISTPPRYHRGPGHKEVTNFSQDNSNDTVSRFQWTPSLRRMILRFSTHSRGGVS